jgi:hypothetical protein
MTQTCFSFSLSWNIRSTKQRNKHRVLFFLKRSVCLVATCQLQWHPGTLSCSPETSGGDYRGQLLINVLCLQHLCSPSDGVIPSNHPFFHLWPRGPNPNHDKCHPYNSNAPLGPVVISHSLVVNNSGVINASLNSYFPCS